MKKSFSVILILIFVVAIIGGIFGFKYYSSNYKNNVLKEGFVLIPHDAKFQQILDSIKPFVKDLPAFTKVAKDKNMDANFKPGRYKFAVGKGNSDLVNMIKAGNQTPNNFRIGDFSDVYQMVGKVSLKTEIDSLNFAKELDKIAIDKGFSTAEDLKKYFFINTYEFFWTVTPAEFFKKFEDQYNEFWTPERIAKEKNIGLDRNQVYALSSIVYKESGGKPDEMKTIAGLYMNRYKKGMKLQSDPTVIYAVNKASNFTTPIKRVYFKYLKEPSPYNTYANAGIPPGPICVTDKNSVDAVLNFESNDYIFMCANPKKFGFHKFTADAAEHAKNAKEYQDWLTAKNIK